MQEQGFQDLRLGFHGRNMMSPKSVIFNAESNFSLFSSTSGSVERCSFASDVLDQDSLASQVSQHLAGHEFSEDSSGRDPDPDPNQDPNKRKQVYTNNFSCTRKGKVKKSDSSEAETTEDENVAVVSARNSFSRALKECQDRRLRSEILLKKPDHRRLASLDLTNPVSFPTSSSPRVGVMKKSLTATRSTGTFPSPGTPIYRHTSVGSQKGWSSERVPSSSNTNKRNTGSSLLPYNNGRTLPSKWEDAERWIFSPVLRDAAVRTSFQQQQQQRRPKSKSGPLGPPGVAYYQMFSPAGNLAPQSPFSSVVMAADGLPIRRDGSESNGRFFVGTEPCMARSVSIHGCSEIVGQPRFNGHHDVKLNDTENSVRNMCGELSRRDMATQMSPESSIRSSTERRSSFSLAATPILPIVEFQDTHSSKAEVRDVPIDEPVSMARWSKKNGVRSSGRRGGYMQDWKRKAANFGSASWEASMDPSKSISTIREEARITAWENLQKAKAESEIRKLEMRLEKKRSSSMDKIMNKLRFAQKKAQDMRSSMATSQANPAEQSNKALSFRRTRQIRPLSGCFTCHAF